MKIEKAAVIGAGVMGSGIAAHLANAGVPVLLLDIPTDNGAGRNGLAEGAVQRMLKSEPAAFMSKQAAKLVTPGNTEDDLARLSDVDWIIEVVVEDLAVKQDLYKKIEAVRRDASVVSSNTSTLPLDRLTCGMTERFARDFLITHFFNPPRYMRLLEIVAGKNTRPDAARGISDFCDRRLGKGIVMCRDTPGFVANRIGSFWLQCAAVEAIDRKLSIEEADAVMGRPLGIPKTGLFGLLDLVGLDLMPKVDASLGAALPQDDAYHGIRRPWPLLDKLIADGYTGRKGKGGFYRLNKDGGGRVKEAIDLETGDYAPAVKPALESLLLGKAAGLKGLVEHSDRGGQYAWAVLSQVVSYAATHALEIADSVWDVDRAMQLGYAWKYGPFELVDRLGTAYVAERLTAEGKEVPALLATAAKAGAFYRIHEGCKQFLTASGDYIDVPRADGCLLLEDIKLSSQAIKKNGSASLWDIGDGVICLEVHTKLNTIDTDVFSILDAAIKTIEKSDAYKALVIYNEGTHFSAGANLGLALFAANTGLWPMIEGMVEQGQKTYRRMKYAGFPVVAAPSGLALGGGCEILLNADAVQAHTESYVGLVEAGVGVIPAWGGCVELLHRFAKDPKRARGPMPPVISAFETIGMAQVAKSAFEAKAMGFLRADDEITFNRERLLADAKARALSLADGYAPPEPIELTLPGPSGKTTLAFAVRDLLAKGVATPHDEVVANALADVLSGGPKADMTEAVAEKEILALERAAFMKMVRTEPTLARMEHTLTTGKPLRN